MKCRRCTGLIIGILNTVCYVGLIVTFIVHWAKLDSNKIETSEQEKAIATSRAIFICVIVFCLIMTVMSGLLIMGIVKKYHKLMLPWMVIATTGYVYNCGHFIYALCSYVSAEATISFISCLVVGLMGFAIAALILGTIFKLYIDIRRDNMEKNDRTEVIAESGYEKHHF